MENSNPSAFPLSRFAPARKSAQIISRQYRPKAEQVRARIEFFAPRLLRRHIGHCTQCHAGAGQVLVGRRQRGCCRHGGLRAPLGQKFRQTEIEQLGVAARKSSARAALNIIAGCTTRSRPGQADLFLLAGHVGFSSRSFSKMPLKCSANRLAPEQVGPYIGS
jgi:hypothetical protein